MTSLSALDILRHPQSGDNSDIKEAMQCAIKALEKQIPKKPISKVLANEGYAWQWTCPNCRIEKVTTEKPFCDDCSQALDWWDSE